MTQWLDGKVCAQSIEKQLKEVVLKQKEKGIIPKLVVLLIGNHPASQIYVKNKEKAALRIGIQTETLLFDDTVTEQDVITTIKQLNANPLCHGILVQTPLPSHINERRIMDSILPSKDVDGFHPLNVGKLCTNQDAMKPCTPYGIMTLLDFYGISVAKKNVVIVGRSNIVGRPMIQLLLNDNATVTVCHSKTEHIETHLQQADIIIVAIGSPHWLKKEWIKDGAVIVDVGMNRLDDGLCGDVDPNVAQKASAITPVPGGVGPMTIAMLMKQTVMASMKEINEWNI